MKREIIKTSDGSTTIHIPEWNEQYHSIHGAIQEANHVYIQHGLNYKTTNEITVLEIGFGTGLNSFMTFLQAQEKYNINMKKSWMIGDKDIDIYASNAAGVKNTIL